MADSSEHLLKRNFDRPDETRTYEDLKIDLIQLGDLNVSRNTFRSGWSWSGSVEPWALTDSCQTRHSFYVISGRITIKMESGEELEFGPGDLGLAPPGHQAWAVGNEPAEVIDFGGCMCTYGERR
jgi:mannose-6-phosphate isomerase-like protein (cupin superfamily)